jgi:hypothetical protein
LEEVAVKILVCAALMALSLTAQSQPISPTNSRPVAIGSSSEPSLQSILDGLFGPSWGSVLTNQSTAGMWRASTSQPTTIPTIVAEFAANSPINKFGIWFASDASDIWTYDLLLGPATVATDAAVRIDNGRIRVGSSDMSACGISVACTSWLYDWRISPLAFGFYFQTGNDPRAYSVDQLNNPLLPRILSFQQGATSNWALAYEDLTLGDADYNDMVVKIESITPVPEPTTLLLMLAGLAVLGLRSRATSKFSQQ